MEVTRKNFIQILPSIQNSIDAADFLVIDAEFTGLTNGWDVSMFDSPQEYYIKSLNGCTDFLLIQYGLCCFYWDESLQKYKNHAYNFYLFPRGRPGPERIFSCQSSSLDFLAAQGFDFNKLVREGISYMTEPEETRLREQLVERQKSYSNDKDIILIPEENKQQIHDICKQVQEFLDEKIADDMEIDKCNAFIRRLLFQELANRFKGQVFVETKVLENKNRVLKVSRVTSENKHLDRDAIKKEKEWDDFEEAVGFSKVARMISQSEKLVIGHNMLLDLLHTLNHFFQPLPADYDSFKEFAHCMFPRILDTKYMSSLPPFKDKVNSSVLSHLVSTLSVEPFTMPKAESTDGLGYSQTDDKHHEAGYDAYVTGLCFLAMHAYLAEMRGEHNVRVSPKQTAILKPFVNKLFLAKTAFQDSPYINLEGKEPIPSRDHVFHLTFPKEWQRNDINQLFSPYGPITVKFLDDTTAFVALMRRPQARDVLKAMGKSGKVSIIPFNVYKNATAKKNSSLYIAQDTKHWRKSTTTVNTSAVSTPDSTIQKSIPAGTVNSTTSPLSRDYDVGEKIERSPSVQLQRQRSNSLTVPAPPASSSLQARKRTSSGVFQVDSAEPPPKKSTPTPPGSRTKPSAELTRSRAEPKAETPNNSSASSTPSPPKKKIDRFDTHVKPAQVVKAFQESDSWD